MKPSTRLIALSVLLAMMFVPRSVHAEEPLAGVGSMQVGNVTMSVGGGTAALDLPDVYFLKKVPFVALGQTVSGRIKDADDFSDEIGWNINGEISAPVGGERAVALRGFWANIEDNDRAVCTNTGGTCILNALVANPANPIFVGPALGATSTTKRDVDQAGVSLELKQMLSPSVTGAPKQLYLALGADWRAIYQDMEINFRDRVPSPTFVPSYNEDLDTNYYGIFAAVGGDYSPFLFGGIWKRLGLQSSFRLHGGVYYAETDYSGSLFLPGGLATSAVLNSNASDTHNEVAFIGGLTLETRKRIGDRAVLSLKSDYEYYSYVPSVNYNDNVGTALFGPNVGTTIGDDDAFSMRTSLRLTIGLGPDELFRDF